MSNVNALIEEWAKAAGVRFVDRSNGECTTSTVSRYDLQQLITAAVARERKRQRDKIDAHIGRSVMSVYGTQPECKAARDALQRLLDDAL